MTNKEHAVELLLDSCSALELRSAGMYNDLQDIIDKITDAIDFVQDINECGCGHEDQD